MQRGRIATHETSGPPTPCMRRIVRRSDSTAAWLSEPFTLAETHRAAHSERQSIFTPDKDDHGRATGSIERLASVIHGGSGGAGVELTVLN